MGLSLFFLFFNLFSVYALPPAPSESSHPGSLSYDHEAKEINVRCSDRDVTIFLPVSQVRAHGYPVVVYGHGQSIGLDHYRETFLHLAKKGVATIFPMYDTHPFDIDFTRMGRDYVNLSTCALNLMPEKLDSDKVIFAGHSKGAFVASVAAGVTESENLLIRPKVLMLFEPGGYLRKHLLTISKETVLHVIFADNDQAVPRKFSEDIYKWAPSEKKQFIYFRSYPELKATHFWPLTKKFLVFGRDTNPFHYYGSWKWLVAAAWDLESGPRFSNPFLYGEEVSDKGLEGLRDSIRRSWE